MFLWTPSSFILIILFKSSILTMNVTGSSIFSSTASVWGSIFLRKLTFFSMEASLIKTSFLLMWRVKSSKCGNPIFSYSCKPLLVYFAFFARFSNFLQTIEPSYSPLMDPHPFSINKVSKSLLSDSLIIEAIIWNSNLYLTIILTYFPIKFFRANSRH